MIRSNTPFGSLLHSLRSPLIYRASSSTTATTLGTISHSLFTPTSDAIIGSAAPANVDDTFKDLAPKEEISELSKRLK